MTITEYAKQFLGRQEIDGSNRGPLVDKWKRAVSKGLAGMPIPWCACFGFAMLAELNALDKKALAKALGFEADKWWPESTKSWHDQAVAAERITHRPMRGDFFLLLKPDGQGGFQKDQPHHLGILDQDGCPAVGSTMDTVEGNTVPGHLGGSVSREGDGVYARTRTVRRGELVFISIPAELKQHADTEGTPGTELPPQPAASSAKASKVQAPPPSDPS